MYCITATWLMNAALFLISLDRSVLYSSRLFVFSAVHHLFFIGRELEDVQHQETELLLSTAFQQWLKKPEPDWLATLGYCTLHHMGCLVFQRPVGILPSSAQLHISVYDPLLKTSASYDVTKKHSVLKNSRRKEHTVLLNTTSSNEKSHDLPFKNLYASSCNHQVVTYSTARIYVVTKPVLRAKMYLNETGMDRWLNSPGYLFIYFAND